LFSNAARESRWLLRGQGSGTRDAVESALVPHRHQLRIGMELGDSEAIKRATAEGLGILAYRAGWSQISSKAVV